MEQLEHFSHEHMLHLVQLQPVQGNKNSDAKVNDNGDEDENENKDKDRIVVEEGHFGICKICNKCQYYVHVDCATSKKDAFMSPLLMPAVSKEQLNHFSHKHMLLLVQLQPVHGNKNSNEEDNDDVDEDEYKDRIVVEDVHFGECKMCHGKTYKNFRDDDHPNLIHCPFDDENANILTHLFENKVVPSQIRDHPHHPQHTLAFMPKTPTNFLGLFDCKICRLPCSGFAYGCTQCEYYVDVHCGFIPDEITHEAHPNHLLLRFKASRVFKDCKACGLDMKGIGFHCPTCDLYLHANCALLLPRTIRHKYDKHPLTLRYHSAENHSGEYFCEICEDQFDPEAWFYHCSACAFSVDTACAPIKLQCERSTFSYHEGPVFQFLNVKFGRRTTLRDHPHPLTFVQGIKDDGQCIRCHKDLQYQMIFKCFECKFALDYWCGLFLLE
ncbi:uncharacterized protein LOC143544248 [Bidens hawaiensis]|uniref:uncharacterized protein LOC143544248 n=1 Tax=Bidens hawaiensis TaxID=980011 RepID=UPI0040490D67